MAYAYSAIIPANVERFILTGTLGMPTIGNQDLTQRFWGNELDNYIDARYRGTFYGNRRLHINGGAGADVMIGSDRANIYVVDNR